MIHKITLKKQKRPGGDIEKYKKDIFRKANILSVIGNNNTLL